MKKPLAVILTDTHKKKDNLELVEDIFEQAIELCVELGCKYVLHGGDFFTNRTGQNLATLMSMKRVLNRVADAGLTMVGIPGNHDKTDLDSEDSYLDIFSNFPGFVLFRDCGSINFSKYDIGISFLPYFSSTYEERLEKMKRMSVSNGFKHNILITHKAFNGVRNNDGSLVSDGASPKLVKHWDKVLVGHYHDESRIGDNIHYIGSSYQANYGENITDKGFTILYSDMSLKKVKSRFKKYIKVTIDASDISSAENELERFEDSEDNIRFVFKGCKTDLSKVNISKFTDAGVQCVLEQEEINEEILKAESGEFKKLDKKEIIKNFFKYCSIQKMSAEDRNFGLKLLKDEIN